MTYPEALRTYEAAQAAWRALPHLSPASHEAKRQLDAARLAYVRAAKRLVREKLTT